MNNADKFEYIENIQKDLTSTCMKSCFNLQNLNVNEQCFDTCYNKYLITLQTVNNNLKDIGYKYQSIIAYKMFPETLSFNQAVHSGDFLRKKRPFFVVDPINRYKY